MGGNIHARCNSVGEQNSRALTRDSHLIPEFIGLWGGGSANLVGKNRAVQMEGLEFLPVKGDEMKMETTGNHMCTGGQN